MDFFVFRSFLNSPLFARKKKASMDSNATKTTTGRTEDEGIDSLLSSHNDILDDSDDDFVGSDASINSSATSGGKSGAGSGTYTNLENFQKKKLKQKLKRFNSQQTSGPYPSPPPAPHRMPHPPRKNLQHASGLLQPSTPLLPRRALNKGLMGGNFHPGATPNSTPNPTPNVRRRGLNALIQQYHQQQNQVRLSYCTLQYSLPQNDNAVGVF